MKEISIDDCILLSIIVPIYKVEPYIIRCLESIRTQDFHSWEALLIDDGTPDKSGEMAKEYAKQYTGFKYIKQANGGLSSARNTGIKNARGKYLMFLDSDDYLVPSSLARIANTLQKYSPTLDILFGDINWISGNKKRIIHKKNIQNLGIARGVDYFKNEIKSSKFHAMAQGGIYLRSFILNNQLFFKNGIYHEDENWMPKVELAANHVFYTPICYYNYEIRPGSITTHGDNIKNGLDIVNTTFELYSIYQNIVSEETKRLAYRYNAKLYLRGASIVIRCGGAIHNPQKIVDGNWITLKERIQFMLFLVAPKFYALIIDKYFL